MSAVGQSFSSMGAQDTHKTPTGDIDFRIKRQLKCWGKEDDPPTRVNPIPVQILLLVLSTTFSDQPSEGNHAVADMIVVTFFYLLRPGEYPGTKTDDASFCMCDVQLWIGNTSADPLVAPKANILAATLTFLVFTTQKMVSVVKSSIMRTVVSLIAALFAPLCAVSSTSDSTPNLPSSQLPHNISTTAK
jgi:hypothetical protein